MSERATLKDLSDTPSAKSHQLNEERGHDRAWTLLKDVGGSPGSVKPAARRLRLFYFKVAPASRAPHPEGGKGSRSAKQRIEMKASPNAEARYLKEKD